MENTLDHLGLATGEYDRVLAQVSDDDLSKPTPCEGWSVRDVVNHLIQSNQAVAAMVRGCSRQEAMAIFGAEGPQGDVAALRVAHDAQVADQLAAFSEDGALGRTAHHVMGDIPTSMLLGFRVGDHTVHAWDLARAIGVDETLDAELVSLNYERMLPMQPMLAGSGVFGEGSTGSLPDDVSLQDKLLDLTGRRP